MSIRRTLLSFKTLLCPVDFSAHSRLALKYAESVIRQSQPRGACLTVLYVSDPLLVAAAGAAYPNRNRMADQTKAELRRFVNASLSPAAARSPMVRLTVAEGDPVQEILSVAARIKADLIVVAAQGRGAIERWLVGSTTQGVLAHATSPVLVVPPVRRRQKTR